VVHLRHSDDISNEVARSLLITGTNMISRRIL